MEHITITQEILKWFAVVCAVMMIAFVMYGGVKGLLLEHSLKTRRR